MKKLLIVIAAIGLSSCASHFKLAGVQTMQEIQYDANPVQHQKLSQGIDLAYVEVGSGPQTIVFIHGLGSYLPAWKKNYSELSNHYRCIAIDLPGYGKSSKGNHAYSMTFYAAVVKEFIEAKGLTNVVLAGHSMGGQIAMTAALQYPQLVDKLILSAPAGFETFNKGQRQWFKDVMTVDAVRLTTPEQIRTNLAYNFYNLPADAQFMIDDRIAMRSADDFTAYCYAITKGVEGMVSQPVYEFLPQIKQPVLVFYGEQDNLIPNRFLNAGFTRKVAEDGASRLPNARLEMIDKAGHFVQFERATEVNALIRDFLK